jgi:UPF0271 protein
MLLNLDAGELPDETEDLWSCADVVSIACGGHAGDAASMARVVAFCTRAGGRASPMIGAHPSYPDRDGFGRRTIDIAPTALADSIAAQCAALAQIARDRGVRIGFVKPHGALYHDAARSPALAALVIDAACGGAGVDLDPTRRTTGLTVIGPPNGALAAAAKTRVLGYLREGFADRCMRPDGTLVPRTQPDALITDPAAAAAQAVALRDDVDIMCVHGDTPGAIAIARAVGAAIR